MASLPRSMSDCDGDFDADCYGDFEEGVLNPPQPPKDLLLQLISLQKATGSWDLVPELAQVFGKTEEEVAKQTPPQVDSGLWATVLALLWLYGFRGEDEDEWQFVAMKAVSWIRAQKGGSVSQCVQAGNTLLGCQVQQGTLGL
ncbi:hypothetical protein SKAU_G00089800 [Synaphobranchus kaupii]|uniref:Uncharacterized protein n=1 Tax=Synaphobranchus kaupii TaxID=118154 RepID=A0A9Q1FWL4_SYNKA|nr:hypothetical protein SKAU_G00089800 [Synaphobranchus kaupii]